MRDLHIRFLLFILVIFNVTASGKKNADSAKRRSGNKSKDNGYPTLSSFPTNYFTETYKKFVNLRPVIGIVPMPLDGDKILSEYPVSWSKEYFGASFVKLIEMTGGRAVSISEDLKGRKLRTMLRKVNGVLIPGGDGDLADSGYSRISKAATEYSREQAKKGIPYPVLGICRGSQMIMQLLSEEEILRPSDSSNITLPLMFTKEARKSQLFGKAPKDLIRVLKEKALTFNAHVYSALYENFKKHPELTKQFRILTTNYDRRGIEFISTYEDKFAPIFGLQWHPEKSLFMHNPSLAIDHSTFAVTAAQYIANFFMGLARQNPNQFKTRKDEEKYLLYKNSAVYVGNITETPYEQVYLFPLYSEKFADRNIETDKKGNKKKKHKIPL